MSFPGPPNEYDFGLDFNYAVWTAGTEINLINVPWNNDYRDIVKFATPHERQLYMDGRSSSGITIDNLSYVKPNEPIYIDVPINRALMYNYLMARNPIQPIPGNDIAREYFYFILDAKYISPNTTQLILQLDVWTTYNFDIEFGNCYVERGHIGIANEHQFDAFGRDHLTTPEGFDIGNEYRIIHRKNEATFNDSGTLAKNDVIAISTVDLLADPGTVDNPKLNTATGSIVGNLPSGAAYYGWDSITNFLNWLTSMSNKPWVTQGIIAVIIVPSLSNFGYSMPSGPGKINPGTLYRDYTAEVQWRDSQFIKNAIPEKYRHLKKMLTYPYLVIEATTWTATPIVIKPEDWQHEDAVTRWVMSINIPGAKLAIYPKHYNAIVEGGNAGEDLNMATQITNMPQAITVNDGAASYLAANKNSIAYQRQNADWSQQKALAAAQTGYDQASSTIGMSTDLTNLGITAANQQLNVTNDQILGQALIGTGQSLIGAISANPVGSLSSGIAGNLNALLQQNTNSDRTAIANALAGQQNAAAVANSGFIRDTNKGLADWSANGDYANAIAGINAKVQDANMIQPTTSGQMGGESFIAATAAFHGFFSLTFKHLAPNARDMIGDYWLRYGYAINRFISGLPKNMMVMENFTYWKLKETYIKSANVPESFKQVIRGIFEKGVTIWANPDKIGVTALEDNAPLEGISY